MRVRVAFLAGLAVALAGCGGAPAVMEPAAVFPKEFFILLKNDAEDDVLADNRGWIWLNFTYANGTVSRNAYVLAPGQSAWESHHIPANGTYQLHYDLKNRKGASGWGTIPLPLDECSLRSTIWLNFTQTPKYEWLGGAGLGGKFNADC